MQARIFVNLQLKFNLNETKCPCGCHTEKQFNSLITLVQYIHAVD